MYCGERTTQLIREEYATSILQQNMALFDNFTAGKFISHTTEDMNAIQDGISQKLGLAITAFSTFFAALIIAFIKSWKLTLVLISVIVAIILTMGGLGKLIVRYRASLGESRSSSTSFAEEVLTSIRESITLDPYQQHLPRKFDKLLDNSFYFGVRVQVFTSLMIAAMMCIIYMEYGLAFWQGSRFIKTGDASVSDILTLMLSILMAGTSLGNIAPQLPSLMLAVTAAQNIFQVIDRQSTANALSDSGDQDQLNSADIEFKSVTHVYPSRPSVAVIQDLSLQIPAGKVTALVGQSGSGKSTIIGLLERFYSPVRGEILINGRNIQSLNLRSLRRQMALVGQEPMLFVGSIYQNIEFGLIGTEFENADETTKINLIVQAAHLADAHEFITALPQGYDTNVGHRGVLLSGGQKQRIVIARTVVRNPKLLMLDEATSALDSHSESLVQIALDKASRGRTTIVVAHRISTVCNADNIIVMSHGRIVEQGKHEDLLALQGVYYNLAKAQGVGRTRTNTDKMETGYSGYNAPEEPAETQVKTLEIEKAEQVPQRQRRFDDDSDYSLWSRMAMVWSLQDNNTWLVLVGTICSIVAGGGMPVQAILYGHSVTRLTSIPTESSQGHGISFWSLMYFMLALTQLLAYSIQGVIIGFATERLLLQATSKAFRALLSQEIAFFDRNENSPKVLSTFLGTELCSLSGMGGATLAAILNAVTAVIASVAISCSFGWKLGLVCTSTMPLLVGSGYLRFTMLARYQMHASKAYAQSADYVAEAFSAIRTVASLTKEEETISHYRHLLQSQLQRSFNSVLCSTLLYAASQSLMFLCMALGFWYGGTLIADHEYSMVQFFTCFMAVVFSGQIAGSVFSFAPEVGRASTAARDLRKLLSRTPLTAVMAKEGISVDSTASRRPNSFSANANETVMRQEPAAFVEFRNVSFTYSSRPDRAVLKNFNIDIRFGQHVAIVGRSGCGKSTVIALIAGFYSPTQGYVTIERNDLPHLAPRKCSRKLALVTQEPTLYTGTIRDNIMLGAMANETEEAHVRDASIEKACQEANILEFIVSFAYLLFSPQL